MELDDMAEEVGSALWPIDTANVGKEDTDDAEVKSASESSGCPWPNGRPGVDAIAGLNE